MMWDPHDPVLVATLAYDRGDYKGAPDYVGDLEDRAEQAEEVC